MFEAFRDCGMASWLSLLIGLAGAAAGVVGLVLLGTTKRGAARVAGAVAALLGVLALVTGVVGRQMHLSEVTAATSGAFIVTRSPSA
jgi:hypothetical protein